MKRRWLLWLLIIAFLWVVVSRFTEIEKLMETLGQGQREWVLTAALLQVVYYIVVTGLYQSAFYTVEVKCRMSELLPVVLASIFVNEGRTMKRFRARAKGRGTRILKRNSHITVTVGDA